MSDRPKRRQQRPVGLSAAEVLDHFTDKSGDCWVWTGDAGDQGYGRVWFEGKMMKAHRLSWLTHRGAHGEGLELDHLCRNRRCVNPDHLEPVSHRENILRGATGPARNHSKSGCVNGHPYTDESTAITKAGHRRCRICDREQSRQRRSVTAPR